MIRLSGQKLHPSGVSQCPMRPYLLSAFLSDHFGRNLLLSVEDLSKGFLFPRSWSEESSRFYLLCFGSFFFIFCFSSEDMLFSFLFQLPTFSELPFPCGLR